MKNKSNIIIIFLVFSMLKIEAQFSVVWDLKKNELNRLLPTDIPFDFRIENIEIDPSVNIKLKIINRIPKRCESELSYESDIVLIDKNLGIAKSPLIIKQNKIYTLILERDARLTYSEYNNLKEYLKNNISDFVKDYIFSEWLKLIPKEGISDSFLTDFVNTELPILLNNFIKQYNSRYSLNTNLTISKTLGFQNKYESALMNIDSFSSNTQETDYSEINLILDQRLKKIIQKMTKKKYIYKSQLNDLDSSLVKYETQLEKELIGVLLSNTIAISTVATFSKDIAERVSKNIVSIFGLSGAYTKVENELYPFSTIGLNFFPIKPINREIPINVTHEWFERFSLYVGTSFIELGQEFLDQKQRFGIINNQTLEIGIGYMIFDGINLNLLNWTFYNQASPHPLITNKKVGWYYTPSITFDMNLKETFAKNLNKQKG